MPTTTTPARGDAGTPPRALRADAVRNRAKVLEAAKLLFSREGLDAQMEDVARAAGVGVGTVYRHFPAKEDLLQALADERFEGLARAAREALEDPDPWHGFVGFMTYSARTMATDRGISEAMDQRPGTCGEAASRAGLGAITAQVVERAKASGELRADISPDDIPSLICSLGRATRTEHGPAPIDWKRYLEILLAGLRAPR